MPLHPPKRTPEGFHMVIDPVVHTPTIRWNKVESRWECSSEMSSWLATQRTVLSGELVSHGNWFSRPPRREMIDLLFSSWSPAAVSASKFVCPTPILPADSDRCISAVWSLDGIVMSAKTISPVWSISELHEEPQEDKINIFEDEAEAEDDGHEIQFHELETDTQTAPTQIKSREWEARKFLGKERVREARLKAQIAKRIAKKEESRYYKQFGDPDENESRMSDFDLTESDSESDSGEHSDVTSTDTK